MEKLWEKLKAQWHHYMLPLAGLIAIVETQWGALALYFGKWAPAVLTVLGAARYLLNFYAAKKPAEEKDVDSPVD